MCLRIEVNMTSYWGRYASVLRAIHDYFKHKATAITHNHFPTYHPGKPLLNKGFDGAIFHIGIAEHSAHQPLLDIPRVWVLLPSKVGYLCWTEAMRLFVLLLIGSTLLYGCACPRQSAVHAATRERLRQTQLSDPKFVEAAAQDVMRYIEVMSRERAGNNAVPAWIKVQVMLSGAQLDALPSITFETPSMTLLDLVEYVAQTTGLTYSIEEGLVVFRPKP
jgi:hypothetical protein